MKKNAESKGQARKVKRSGPRPGRTGRVAPPAADEMRPEYDFRGGVRGKYTARLRGGSNVVVLDPDVAAAFGSPEAVNRALRALADLIREQSRRRSRRRTA